MSVLKFELTDKHISLLKHLEWKDLTSDNQILTNGEETPFGGFDYYEDMGVILYGKPKDFDPFDGNPFNWSDEEKEEMDKLLNELPLALDVVLNTQSFEPGNYKTRFHIKDWKLLKK